MNLALYKTPGSRGKWGEGALAPECRTPSPGVSAALGPAWALYG